ncbi:MAG TPA: ABC transporter permease [Tepidisphaeraceae bacterium]|nr:ABC transporter permease [Tepidisphaeraceae bacterium]
MTALVTLYILSLRQQMHGKRWIVMSLLFLLPALLALIVHETSPDAPALALEFTFVFMFIPQAILPLAALIDASGTIQDELEEQTITYLLIRPISRWAIYVVKLAGAITMTLALTAIFTAVTYAVIYGLRDQDAARRCLTAISIHCLAVACYCCIFSLLGLITRRILVAGVLYIVIVEGLLANLPFGIRLITVIYYARLIAYRTLPFVLIRPEGPRENLAADAWQLDIASDPQLLEHPSLHACIAVLLLAIAILTALGALLCMRREFHVKTPEKN